jgi:hypothetical protein
MRRRTILGGFGAAFAATGGLLTLAGVVSPAAALPAGCSATGTAVTCTYGYTGGEQTFVAPAGVTAYHVLAVGAAGGNSVFPPNTFVGGGGATVSTDLTLTPGTTYYVNVGGAGQSNSAYQTAIRPGGYNGGGAGGNAATSVTIVQASAQPSGGGATSLQTLSGECNLTGALVIAGGGGGAGGFNAQGGNAGQNGTAGGNFGVDTGGGGGSQTQGGAGGTSPGTPIETGTAGSSCRGGTGGPAAPQRNSNGGGGGGGGYFGGGGGGSSAGGGGGSSFAVGAPAYSAAVAGQPASLTISYVDPTLPTPLVDPAVGAAAFAALGAAVVVVTSRRRRPAQTSRS